MKQKLAKLAASQDADRALTRMLEASSEDFRAGRITKSDLLSWIILHFERESFLHVKEEIRKSFFDELAYLETVLKDFKSARKAGQVQPSLTELLAPISKGEEQ